MTIHWCGTGLSAVPGLRKLLMAGQEVCVWNRSVDKAQAAVGDLTDWIEKFDIGVLQDTVEAGDLVVSMLPGDWHVPLAIMCLTENAHFVSSSYISPEMAALNQAATDAGLCFVNEVGLDPGIDHVMAHWLMADMAALNATNPDTVYSFLSYCGGIPKNPNPFRYKFSWSPIGVLKALRSPSKSVRNFEPLDVARPWDAITSYSAPLPAPETFEVYPNRDSLPFMAEYGFGDDWNVREFVRGTLRLNGWKDAWADVFTEIETLTGDAGEVRLKEVSDAFWSENAYGENDPDRVVLVVELKAENDDATVYHKTYVLDAWGDADGTAMARLVSVPVALAIEAALNGEIPVGVSAAPNDPKLVARWMETVGDLSQHLTVVDHLNG